jgi:hypothetical protein
MEMGRILDRDLFLYLLDLEVKRARRYQNFFCILSLKVSRAPGSRNGKSLQHCFETLTHWLERELRESDILGSLGNQELAALLPYADISAGGNARSRFEGNLKDFNFKNDGFQLTINQVCFPSDGTDTADLVRKITGAAAA